MPIYQRTTVSRIAVALLALLLAVPVALLVLAVNLAGSLAALLRLAPWLLPALAALALVPLLLFAFLGTLTVTVDKSALRAWFGVGLVRREIPLELVTAARPGALPPAARRPAWRYWPPRAFLLEGDGVVEVSLVRGTQVLIGSPNPESLAALIEAAAADLARRGNEP